MSLIESTVPPERKAAPRVIGHMQRSLRFGRRFRAELPRHQRHRPRYLNYVRALPVVRDLQRVILSYPDFRSADFGP